MEEIFRNRQYFNYYNDLQEPKWKVFRDKILSRDNSTCQVCKKKEGEGVVLNVHHKRYLLGHRAWQYEDKDLVTLCEKCHEAIHREKAIPVYKWNLGKWIKVEATICERCHGMGYIPQFLHVQRGICFLCWGTKYYYHANSLSPDDAIEAEQIFDSIAERVKPTLPEEVVEFSLKQKA